MIAHELKQPLGAAAAYCFALRRRMESGEVSAEMMEKGIERVDHQIQRASEVVNQVRSYAKGQRQRLTVDVGKTAEKILLDISASAPDTDLEFRKDSEELFVEANPIELEIILINLVKNAIEVVKDKSNGRVVVTLSAEGNTVCIKVEDNGEKLSDAEWNRYPSLRWQRQSTADWALAYPLLQAWLRIWAEESHLSESLREGFQSSSVCR